MIRGEFDLSDPYPRPWIRVLVFLEGLSSSWTEVRFLIDTGAGLTALYPRDALAVGVPRRTLLQRAARGDPTIDRRRIGGMTESFETVCSYAFQASDGALHRIDGTIRVVRATTANTALPAILGWDILRDFHLTIQQDTGLIALDPIRANIFRVLGPP